MPIKYSSNNSGGYWWLTDDDWKNLEAGGWEVHWFRNDTDLVFPTDEDGRWLGALAMYAIRRGVSLEAAQAEFQDITGIDADDEGCNCCGQPHNFYEVDDNGDWI